MIVGVAYSKPRAALSAAGLAAAFAMAWLQHHITGERHERLRQTTDLERNLANKIAAMSDFEDRNRDELRAQVDKFRVQLGPEGAWNRLVRQFGKDWTVDAGPRDDMDGYSVQVGTFRLQSPVTSDWSKIVEAVKASEQLPGVGIVGFEMKTSGDREHRSVNFVRVEVAIQTVLSTSASARP
jgi:hypothetical protein